MNLLKFVFIALLSSSLSHSIANAGSLTIINENISTDIIGNEYSYLIFAATPVENFQVIRLPQMGENSVVHQIPNGSYKRIILSLGVVDHSEHAECGEDIQVTDETSFEVSVSFDNQTQKAGCVLRSIDIK